MGLWVRGLLAAALLVSLLPAGRTAVRVEAAPLRPVRAGAAASASTEAGRPTFELTAQYGVRAASGIPQESSTLDPRAGGYLRLALAGGAAGAGRVSGQGLTAGGAEGTGRASTGPAGSPSGLGWAVAVAVDGLHVPFHTQGQALHPNWDPDSVGLRDPAERPAAGRVDELWVSYGWAGGPSWFSTSAWAGRRRIGLGLGTGLFPIALAPGLDQVGARVQLGPAAYEKLVGRLEPGDRFLLAHQLELGPWEGRLGRLELLGYEVGVVSRAFAELPYTWIPLWPGYLTQDLNLAARLPIGNDHSNFYMGLGGRWTGPFGWPVALDAEVMVDDMPQLPWIQQLYQLGGTAGLQTTGGRVAAALGGSLALRYTRVNNFVITFQESSLSLIHAGRPLAYPDGPDADSLRLDWTPWDGLRPEALRGVGFQLDGVGLEWRRRGAGRIGDMWEHLPGKFGQAKSLEFLSGPVEQALLLHLRLAGAGDSTTVALSGGPLWNAANVQGQRGLLLQVRLHTEMELPRAARS